MNRINALLLSLSLFFTVHAVDAAVKGDRAALEFVKQNSNTYIAIVWPRAYEHKKYISKKLSSYGNTRIVQSKTLRLSEAGAWHFFKNAHRGATSSFMRKTLKNYLTGCKAPFKLQALLLQTDLSLEELIKCKKAIREKIGISYWSIHINDTHQETLEMAEVVYDKERIKALNKLGSRDGYFITDPFLY